MKRKYWILVITVPSVFILDQVTKWLVLSRMPIGERMPVITGFFDMVHFRNTGAAFGLFANMADGIRAPFFYIVAIVAAVVMAFMYRAISDREVIMPFALSLVFAGIAGNVIDRIRYGEVVDFLSFHVGDRVFAGQAFGYRVSFPLEWPAFNVADMAITCAMILIVISAFSRSRDLAG